MHIIIHIILDLLRSILLELAVLHFSIISFPFLSLPSFPSLPFLSLPLLRAYLQYRGRLPTVLNLSTAEGSCSAWHGKSMPTQARAYDEVHENKREGQSEISRVLMTESGQSHTLQCMMSTQ
jgi:hypothetical protein